MSVSFFNRFSDLRKGGTIYPSPFFDIGNTYLPPSIKELFKWAKLYFYTHFAIRPVIVKLSAYPITDLVYTGDLEQVKKWKYILDETLNIKSHFINCGLDYNAMGNSVVSLFFPFQRWLKCQQCKKTELIDNVREWTFRDLTWKGICMFCDAPTTFDAQDKYVQDLSRINLIRWSIENIDVEYNEITGISRYFYTIPTKVKKSILTNNKRIISETPLRFIQAVKEDKPIELTKENVFHMKQTTLAEEDQGYGKPIILSAMKDAFYLQILRKANEAIAFQHIVPLNVLFPEGNASLDPYRHLNLAEWKTRVEEEIERWKQDNNHIPIMPVPLGVKQIFGDAKALMVTPEIRSVTEQIITGMGVPQEFVFGGMQWSGSHVSLRMIENQLLRHREQMTRMLNFIVDRISRFFRLKKIEIKFSDFKMADDIQLKQIVGNLVAGNKISLQSYVQEFGYQLETEQKQILKETEFTNKLQKMQMIAQADAQSEAMMISSRAQTKAQLEQKKVVEDVQHQDVVQQLQGMLSLRRDQMLEQQQMAQEQQKAVAQGQPPQGQPTQEGAPAPAQPEAGSKGDGGKEKSEVGSNAGFSYTAMDPRFMARQFASQLGALDDMEQDRVMQGMKDKMPNLYELTMAQKQLMSKQRQGMPVAKDTPKAKPPRRNKSGTL